MTVSESPELSESEYQARVEKNLATLQKDLPTLFAEDISYDIYTPDIYFNDPVNTFKYKFNYRIIFWTLRFHAQLFFREIYFDVHNIRQAAKDVIKVDWTVRGTLRVPWQAKVFFNGNSTYKMNEEGLIYEHLDTWDRKPQEILKQFLPTKRQKS
ncbi:DUF2358 domain-containing protein [Oscillatoria salina]|uniref:DUF2358 domain-containing protein n=1 Tax=Oscillatoria salina TaxID=331517 RepID=UPI0013B8029C|nr:DUF2358 domain-containing protein [Oscillatoria salina]MBZ8180436.1 DUF2358 domain-containing protein [Oscillatoria salina IIICB1]NET89470.1 DUF2358 domain-containing protein [Kamptonema sp. SIO1D9]